LEAPQWICHGEKEPISTACICAREIGNATIQFYGNLLGSTDVFTRLRFENERGDISKYTKVEVKGMPY
jgi:hypothetical protein